MVLGEPGIGKTRLVEQFCGRSGTATSVSATALPAHSPLREEAFPKKTVIDEVDAVAAADPGKIVAEVIRHLGHFRTASFVLTCRSADWAAADGARLIREKWGQAPTVGTLLPLNDDGITRIVSASDTGRDGEEILDEARQRGLAPLLGNPQLLGMLLKSAGKAWPESRRDLHERACLALARETRPTRGQAGRRHRHKADELLDTAGFVFAQLLLSGAEGIWTRKNNGLPGAADLSSDRHNPVRVADATGTGLFRMRADGVLVPRHRTIAEFLAAKWLARTLERAEIRVHDLEALLRAKHSSVPSSLRGVHAWVATLSKEVRQPCIARDPLGFWCHGDRDALADEETVELLGALNGHARRHPGLGNWRGQTGFGRWPSSDPVRARVRELVGDSQTAPEMIPWLVESVRDESCAAELKRELRRAVRDVRNPNSSACLVTLGCHISGADLGRMIRESLNGAVSAHAAIEATRDHPGKLGAKLIADVLAEVGCRDRYLVERCRFHRRLPPPKLKATLDALKRIAATEGRYRARGARICLVPFLERLLVSGAAPTPASFWECLALAGVPPPYANSPDRPIATHLAKHQSYRRRVQACAILGEDPAELETRLFQLWMDWPALFPSESDWVFHLGNLAARKPPHWRKQWRALFDHGKVQRFSEDSVNTAREFAKSHGLTSFAVRVPKRAPVHPAEESFGAASRRRHEIHDRKRDERHMAFAAQRESISSGRALDLLDEAAKKYAGFEMGGERLDTPEKRIADWVGKEMVDIVLAGIRKVATGSDTMPTAREFAEFNARYRSSPHEDILLAYCIMSAESPVALTQCRPGLAQSALAACRLNTWARENPGYALAVAHLEKSVLTDPRSAEQHFRDMTEPFLATNADRVPGINLLLGRPDLSGMASRLAHEWIRDFPELRDHTFRNLLDLAAQGDARAKVARFVRAKIKSDTWTSQDERGRYMCAAFELDFAGHRKEVTAYANENRNHIAGLATSVRHMRDPSPEQLRLVVETFASWWPPREHSHATRPDDMHWLEAAHVIGNIIRMLENDTSHDATDALFRLVESGRLGEYRQAVQAAYVTQRQRSLDRDGTPLPLDQVRSVLLPGRPVDHRHLQGMVAGALSDLQKHTRSVAPDGLESYWTNRGPRCGSSCREHLKDALASVLAPHGVSVHTEAPRPRGCTASLLCRFTDDVVVPVEVRNHWSSDVWDAPKSQLVKRAEIRGANRTAVYVVLWFGRESGHQIPPYPSHDSRRPQSARELKAMLNGCSGNLPYNLVTHVMDLSRHGAGQDGPSKSFASHAPGVGVTSPGLSHKRGRK